VWPADFTGDGFTDLAGSEPPPHLGGSGRVLVLVGNGAGNFTATNVSSYVGRVLGVGDFNGDGERDLIVADARAANVAILPGNGNATFAAPIAVAPTTEVTFAVSSDIDGDGARDLVIGAEGYTVNLYPGNGDFTFGAPVTLTVNASPHDAVITDLDADGRKDLVVANHYHHSVTVLMNRGALVFSGADVALTGNGNDVTAADVNGDAKADLIVATSNGGDGDYYFEQGHAEVLLGRGDGTFAAGPVYEVARGAWQVVVGDFTRDGMLDIATANRSSIVNDDSCGTWWKTWDSLSILPGRAGGTFGAPFNVSLGNQSNTDDEAFKNQVRTLNTADLNRDGATDLIASWGLVLLNAETDANWPAAVDAGPDQEVDNTHDTVLRARAVDDDQDMLTWTWRDDTGAVVGLWPDVCVSGLRDGLNTFTVSVDDGHGHITSDTVTVTVRSDTGGGTTGPTMTLTAPAEGETIAAGSPYTIKFHVDDPSMELYQWSIRYSIDNGATWDRIWECFQTGRSSGPGVPTSRDEQCVWQNPGPPSTQAMIRVYAQDDADGPIGTSSSAHIKIAARTGAVPDPWKHQDIGAVAAAGTATAHGLTTFTVSGSGADIWNGADEFHFTYQTLEHDAVSPANDWSWEMTTYVTSVQNAHAWTKAGIMIREGLGASARHASVIVSPSKGIAFQRRTSTGGASVSTAGPLLAAPVWLKLGVRGGTVSAYYRKTLTDPWTVVGRQAFTTFSEVKTGLAVTSHADGVVATAGFANVELKYSEVLRPADIGTTGGGTTSDGVITSVTGKGADIWGTSDQFHYASTFWSYLDGSITARVRSVENVHAWTKAGVMFRESSSGSTLDANGKYVFVMVTPGKGVTMQFRSTTGGAAASVAGATIAGAAPGLVRLAKNGDTYTGYWSKDGATWTALGSITVPMAFARIYTGLAVTSHNTSTAATASFDDVRISQP
jgi:hypothetical protein